MFEFHMDKEKLRVYLTMQPMGADMCVHIFGGSALEGTTADDRINPEKAQKAAPGATYPVLGAHVGAVALALPPHNTSDKKPGRKALTRASLLTVPGHREDLLARSLALRAACRCKSRVVLACGLHVDNATPADIQNLEHMANSLMETLLTHLHFPKKDTTCCN